MIVQALWRALPQVFRPVALSVLAKSLALTLLLFAALGWTAWWALGRFFAWIGWGEGGTAQAVAAAAVAMVAGWLLFRAVAMAVMGLFSDQIVAAVEQESYPAAAARAKPLSMMGGLSLAARSLSRAIGWNLVALPLYVALLVTGVGTIALLIAVNGYLLGRDLAEMVEGRHPDYHGIPPRQRFAMGVVSALIFLIPVANLLAPVWSAAMAVHVMHGRREKHRHG